MGLGCQKADWPNRGPARPRAPPKPGFRSRLCCTAGKLTRLEKQSGSRAKSFHIPNPFFFFRPQFASKLARSITLMMRILFIFLMTVFPRVLHFKSIYFFPPFSRDQNPPQNGKFEIIIFTQNRIISTLVPRFK